METVQKDRQAAIAMGANIGFETKTPENTLLAAVKDLVNDSVRFAAMSRLFRTPAFPPGSGPDYVNAVMLVQTDLPPERLLQLLHDVEHKFARARTHRWAPRTLDLDLLWYGDRILPDRDTQRAWIDLPADVQKVRAPDRLILPHPRLQDRAFVLIPLLDVAPDWVHPVTGRSLAQMVAALAPRDIAAICPV